jgi:multiple sugar transport system permease protein
VGDILKKNTGNNFKLIGDILNNTDDSRFKFEDKHYAFLFLAPAILALIILTIGPLIYTFKTSFFAWDLVKPGSDNIFIGLGNYKDLFSSNEFWKALFITLEFTILSVVFEMIIGTALAFLMFQNLKGSGIVRTLIITAMIITPVVVGTAWRLMYNPGWGLINYFLDVIGIGGKAFLAEKSTVIPALIVTDIWQWAPLVMVIVLAALQGLPEDVYEAARVDGASYLKTFRYVTLPLLTPSLLLALLIRTMDSFRTFDIIFAMTGGGPGTESQNINILMYNTGFEFFQISKAASMAIVSLIIITVISIFIVKIFRKEESEIW